MELNLIVKYPDGKTESFTLKNRENLIGRDPNIAITLSDKNVSTKHANIFFKDSMFWCADGYKGNPSRNGTWVNNKRVTQPVPLEKGDILLIGACRLLIKEVAIPHVAETEEISVLKGKEYLTIEDFHKLQLQEIDSQISYQYLKIISGVLILGAILVFGLWLLWSSTAPVPQVLAKKVSKPKDTFYFSTFALPGRNFNFEAPISGKIYKVLKSAGEIVRKDDALVKLEEKHFKENVERLKASWEIAKLEVEKLKNNEIPRLKQSLDRFKNTLTQSEINYKKYEENYKKGIGNSEKLIELKKNYEKSKERATYFQHRYDEKLKTLTIREKKLELARKAYKNAQWELNDLTIKSPINGRIKDMLLIPGAYIQKGKSICRIVDISKIKLCLRISEKEFPNWQEKQSVNLSVDQIPSRRFMGQIQLIMFRSEGGIPLFEVIIDVRNTDEIIQPGMMVKIYYNKRELEKGFFIPASCIFKLDNEPYVYKVKKKKCIKSKVKVLKKVDGDVIISKGLQENDLIIISPDEDIKEGSVVKVVSIK